MRLVHVHIFNYVILRIYQTLLKRPAQKNIFLSTLLKREIMNLRGFAAVSVVLIWRCFLFFFREVIFDRLEM